MENSGDNGAIELRLADSAQLFNTLDPFPFRERDLAPEAEQYILDWAETLPKDQPISIIVHLQSANLDRHRDSDLQQAINGWFRAREAGEARDMKTLFRDGRIALCVGFVMLGLFMLLSWTVAQNYDNPFARVISESLVIIGWVVLWRPAEMFLYDWTPILRRKRLFHRLAEARVTIHHAGRPGETPADGA
ncbi:hypothetical protein GCM10019059_17900 [Camelimonas fluminis]|uniref:Uncharacterized protein n=1 Tax=Camelimonas fluminis TaxID=1576911 RepID=A0ABV7UIT1_9HYPH|nr:hypothetical protein [Camelimonas fluminis]GHE58815.1 hypothetical protein GCM10019059_17900 [Camelimonas fluminis]